MKTIVLYFTTIILASVFYPAQVKAAEEKVGLVSSFSDLYLRRHLDKGIALHGYTSFKYIEKEGENGTFDQHIFEPFFGYQVNDHVFAKIIFEFEHSPEFQGSGLFSEFFIEQAEVDITFQKGTTIGFGAILVPFGLENYLHAPPDNRLITRPPMMHGDNAILRSTWTDVGIQFTHAINEMGVVDLYLINGSAAQGKEERGRDTKGPNANNGKSIGAEIQVTQVDPRFNVGLSGVIGPHDTGGDLDSWRLGLHALFDNGITRFRGEYLIGTDEGLATAGQDRDVEGFYLIVTQTLFLPGTKDKLDVSVRYADWTIDDKQALDFSELAFAARYRLFRNTWLKVEQQYLDEEGTSLEEKNDAFSLQLTVLF